MDGEPKMVLDCSCSSFDAATAEECPSDVTGCSDCVTESDDDVGSGVRGPMGRCREACVDIIVVSAGGHLITPQTA